MAGTSGHRGRSFGNNIGESSTSRASPTLVPREIKVEKPMTFGGKHSDLQNFIFLMRQYIDTVGLGSEGKACRFLVSYLRDDALTWWRMYSGDSLDIFDNITLDVLFDELCANF